MTTVGGESIGPIEFPEPIDPGISQGIEGGFGNVPDIGGIPTPTENAIAGLTESIGKTAVELAPAALGIFVIIYGLRKAYENTIGQIL